MIHLSLNLLRFPHIPRPGLVPIFFPGCANAAPTSIVSRGEVIRELGNEAGTQSIASRGSGVDVGYQRDIMSLDCVQL
jgi:hypothetical protein